MNEPRPGLPGPKVSFASRSRWGTEPEGWYVDLPYALFLVGVNYSPLECRRSNRGVKFVSIAELRTSGWVGWMLTWSSSEETYPAPLAH